MKSGRCWLLAFMAVVLVSSGFAPEDKGRTRQIDANDSLIERGRHRQTLTPRCETGGSPAAVTAAPLVAQGTLVLEFVDRGDGNSDKTDPERIDKSLDLVAKAILHCEKGFHPRSRRSDGSSYA